MIKLTRIEGGRPVGSPLMSDKRVLTLGRDQGSDLVFIEGTVSGSHAIVQFQDGWYQLSVVGNNNGVYMLSADKPEQVGRSVHLRRGDQFMLGNPGPCIEVDFVYDQQRFTAEQQAPLDDVEGVGANAVIVVVIAITLLVLVLLLSLSMA